MWLKVEGFKELLKSWWQNLNFCGSHSYILVAKLKALKGLLKSWNKEVFGEVGSRKSEALHEVIFWDDREKDKVLTLEEAEARATTKEDFKKWCLLEEMPWRQKSWELWLKEGDRNTSFFHKMANSHRRRSFMGKIKIEGRWVEEESEIRKGIVEAFQSLLTYLGGWRPNFPSVALSNIGLESATKIEKPFTEEEIFAALSELNGDKAPGPDGFSMAF